MTEIAVDLISDTVTRPTPAMRRAIAEAEVGDEQNREDPTVNRLQEKVAELQQSKRQLADAILSADAGLVRTLRAEDLEMLLS